MTIVKYLLSIALGAALGYLSYKKVGCPNGSCPITSSPYRSTLYGGVMGFLLAGMI